MFESIGTGKWRPNSLHPTIILKAYAHVFLWQHSYAIFPNKKLYTPKNQDSYYKKINLHTSSCPRISFTLALCSISTVWIFRCNTAAAHSSVVDVNLLRGFSRCPSCWKSWGKSSGRISWDEQKSSKQKRNTWWIRVYYIYIYIYLN